MIKEFYYYDSFSNTIIKSKFEIYSKKSERCEALWQNLSSDDYDLHYEDELFENYSQCLNSAIESIKEEIESLQEKRFNLIRQDFL